MSGVARCLLAALSPLALLGLRYPLKMLPILLFELLWKAAWLGTIGVPLWLANGLDAARGQTFKDCAFGVILCLVVIPWGYVIREYVRAAGDRWKPLPARQSSGDALASR